MTFGASRPPMRRIFASSRALSEIVGTLFLVLIVVAAATSFSVFLAQYQKQAQANQAVAHDRALESLHVLHVVPQLNTTSGTSWLSANFTVGSSFVNPSTITSVAINNIRLKQFVAWSLNTTTGTITSTTVATGGIFTMGPSEDVAINVTFSATPSVSSFFSGFVLTTTSYLTLDLYTALLNVFSATFIPPSAVALVTPLQQWTGTGFVTVPELDGSGSFQSGNATLVQWAWNVSPGANFGYIVGEKALFNLVPGNGTHTYNVTLVVTNSDGLLGTDKLRYVYP